MNVSLFRVALCVAALSLVASGCGDDSDTDGPGTGGTGGTAGTGGTNTGTSTGSGGTGATGGGFDPNNPGIHMFLELGAVLMMGQSIELAVAGFMPAAREDFDPPDPDDAPPIDTCVVADDTPPTPECSGPQDCAPEQQCLPENDQDGNPIPGSEHCVTPRELMDVGPMTLEGMTTGPTQLTYNSEQSGAYTVPGTDGSLQAGTLAFDTTYTFHGDGDAAQGLGAFNGEIYLPPALTLTSPPMVELGMPGVFGIQIDPNQDLVLQWSGSAAGGQLRINLVGAQGETIDCLATDDGEFTIPAAMVQAAGLGDIAFLNMLTIDRQGEGTVSGDGITYHDIGMLQTLLINVGKL